MLPYAPWVVWILPIIIAFTHFIWEKISTKLRDFIAVASGFIISIFAASMIPDVINGYVVIDGVKHSIPFDWVAIEWVPIPGYTIKIGVLVDPLSVFMANIVAWIGSLILLYSVEYMRGDEGITRYWMLMNFFIGVMELLVLSDNLLGMFFGWEGVGFASYALIGYWYRDERKYWIDKYPPSHCGMKAFITTRIGDVGLLVSIIIIFIYSGSLNYVDLASNPGWLTGLSRDGILILTLLMFFLGPIGKSAQFPLHVWLPEAMAGPTTVSALIHAATMVKAGVYLVARLTLMLYLANAITGGLLEGELLLFYLIVAWIGGFTAFLAASMGLVSDQIKKVLAYSTISQLGYMFSIIGVAGLLMAYEEAFMDGILAGISHLFSHAVFKALLFLSAGAIGHAVESYMLRDMGGLRKYMPKTYLVMLIGALSLSGVPPFNGFWSKDMILHLLSIKGFNQLFILLSITAILTVFYTFRMIGLVFHGEESSHVKHLIDEGHKPHDPGIFMSISLWILAIASIVGGFLIPWLTLIFKPGFKWLGISEEAIKHLPMIGLYEFIEYTVYSETFIISLGIIFIGFSPAWYTYISKRIDPVELVRRSRILSGLWGFLYRRWYINDLYYIIFVNGLTVASSIIFNVVEDNGGGNRLKSIYISLSNIVRRIQTGILRLNMAYIILGLLLFIILMSIMG